MALPVAAVMALKYGIPAAGSFFSSLFGNRSKRQEAEKDRALQRQQLQLQESGMDPFRQQRAQGSAISSLDRLERSTYSPVQMQGAAPYASFAPEMSGGYSYQKSPELTAAAGALKGDVLAGRTANGGRNAVLNLLAPQTLAPPRRRKKVLDDEEFAPSYQ